MGQRAGIRQKKLARGGTFDYCQVPEVGTSEFPPITEAILD